MKPKAKRAIIVEDIKPVEDIKTVEDIKPFEEVKNVKTLELFQCESASIRQCLETKKLSRFRQNEKNYLYSKQPNFSR